MLSIAEQDVEHSLEPIAAHLLASGTDRNAAQELILVAARRMFRLAALDAGQPLTVASEQAEKVAVALIPEN